MAKLLPFCLLLFFLCCTSCQKKPSLATLRTQFQQSEVQLLNELEAIVTPSDFELHERKTSEIFEDIAEEMVLVNTFSPEEIEKEEPPAQLYSENLEKELKRILSMPGGEEWLIRCQTKATRLIDIQLHKVQKKHKK